MGNINYTFSISFIIITLGYVCKRLGVLSKEHGKSASRLIINITLPALILKTISVIEIDYSLGMLPFLCWFISGFFVAAAFILFKKESGQDKGVALLCSLGFNVGLFAFPIIEAIFGEPGVKIAAMFDLGNAFIVFGLAYFISYYYSSNRINKNITFRAVSLLFLKSIPFMSYVVALVLNLTGFRMPAIVLDVLTIFAGANKALVLLVLGIMLNFSFDKKHWKLILKLLALRYVLGLILGTLVLLFFPFSGLYKRVLFLCIIIPLPLAVIPHSVEFNYDPEIAGTVLNFMIIISFFLMWGFLLLYGVV